MHGVTPVIAHVERYFRSQDGGMIRELMDMDVLIQINAEYILNCHPSFKVRHLIRDGRVDLLGSDTHNLDSRKPNLGPARDLVMEWGLTDELLTIRENSRRVLGI